ncbi:DNA polymerase III [Mycobacterium phage MalagasyRose]|uniref:DNA polymerase III n=1 Tax=Mycobacterium phage MalagasyRose TaxID=2599870 RepID=A0A5J6TDJ8_9CAUD|nr:DNA polymerase III [Mycobacterium phage MalagasyRose]QFG08906.1 DNA polymerase III [Mycobacterium phage MalagasyRose]
MTEARRHLVVVDLETTGLHDDAAILEVAAVNVDTGEELHFVPFLAPEALAKAEPKALQINRYFERGLFEQALTAERTMDSYRQLQVMLRGNTFGGSNPAFDSALVARAVIAIEVSWLSSPKRHAPPPYVETVGRVWHHRLGDLAAYAAGPLGIDVRELEGLDQVLGRLGMEALGDGRHTALGDARATVAAFMALEGHVRRRAADAVLVPTLTLQRMAELRDHLRGQ